MQQALLEHILSLQSGGLHVRTKTLALPFRSSGVHHLHALSALQASLMLMIRHAFVPLWTSRQLHDIDETYWSMQGLPGGQATE